jgi:hypothetical protein
LKYGARGEKRWLNLPDYSCLASNWSHLFDLDHKLLQAHGYNLREKEDSRLRTHDAILRKELSSYYLEKPPHALSRQRDYGSIRSVGSLNMFKQSIRKT